MTVSSTTQTEKNAAAVAAAIAVNHNKKGPLLPILHEIQGALGHIPSLAVGQIAQALNLSRAEVHGVISFYHSFTNEPQGKHVIEVCRAESCQAMGGRDIEAAFKAKLGLDWGETSNNRQVTLEPVYCLGNCACSPSVRIGTNIYGRVNEAQVDELVAKLSKEDH